MYDKAAAMNDFEKDLRKAWYLGSRQGDRSGMTPVDVNSVHISSPNQEYRPGSRSNLVKTGKKRRQGPKFLRKPLTWYIFMALATAGLVWQLYDIIHLFFAYGTVTELLVVVPSNITAPALSICLPYDNFLIRSKLIAKFPQLSNITSYRSTDVDKFVTIKDIFDMTPKIADLFVYCMYRQPREYVRFIRSGAECAKIFSVQQYYKQQYMCYQFNLLTGINDNFTFDYIQNSLVSPGMFFEVDFKRKPFSSVDNIQAIIHAPDIKPRGNKAFPVAFSRTSSTVPLGNENITLKDDFFSLSYSMFVNNLLPKPYWTDCLDYQTVEYESQEACIDECVTLECLKINKKVPFTAVQTEPVDKLHVSISDNEKEEFAKQMAQLKQDCGKKCSQSNCVDEIYVTKFIRSEAYDNIAFRVYVANEPTLRSTFKPKLSLTEFLVYALSCFGIWFGLSFFSFVGIAEQIEQWWRARREEKSRIERSSSRNQYR